MILTILLVAACSTSPTAIDPTADDPTASATATAAKAEDDAKQEAVLAAGRVAIEEWAARATATSRDLADKCAKRRLMPACTGIEDRLVAACAGRPTDPSCAGVPQSPAAGTSTTP